MSRITQLCFRIAEHLNTKALGVPFIAERVNLKRVRLEDLRTPAVFVSPSGLSQAIVSRGDWRYEYEIDLVVCQAVQLFTLNEEDALITLAEELPMQLLDGDFGGAVLTDIEGDASRTLFDEVQLETGALFFGIISVHLIEEVTINGTSL